MPGRLVVSLPGLGSRTVVFESKIAGAFGRGSEGNLAMSPNASVVLVESDYIMREHLGHEWGHGEDARAMGWRYLPWVLTQYLLDGTETSLPERRADAWFAVHRAVFDALPGMLTPHTVL